MQDTEISLHKFDSKCFLKVGNESIEVSDYKITSSMRGGTELVITVNLNASMEEHLLLAKIELLTQQS